MRVGRRASAHRGRPEPAEISAPKIALLDSMYPVCIPVHDNVLLSCSVSAREKESRFHTASPDDDLHEYTGVIFSDVVAYLFEHDNFFRDGREHAWPVVYESKEDLLRRMHDEDVRAFGAQASCGPSARVWAQSVSSTGTGRR